MTAASGRVQDVVRFSKRSVTVTLEGDPKKKYCVLKPHRLVSCALRDTPWQDDRDNAFPVLSGARVILRKSAKQAPPGPRVVTWYDLEDLRFEYPNADSATAALHRALDRRRSEWLESMATKEIREALRDAPSCWASVPHDLVALLTAASDICDAPFLRQAARALTSVQVNVAFGRTLAADARRFAPDTDAADVHSIAQVATENGLVYDSFRKSPLSSIKRHTRIAVESGSWKFLEAMAVQCGISDCRIESEWVDSLMLHHLHEHGHMYLPLHQLQAAADRTGRTVDCRAVCETSDAFHIVGNNVYRTADYRAERSAARMLVGMEETETETDSCYSGEDVHLPAMSELTDEQQSVVHTVVGGHNAVTCVVGFPGVGKSRVVRDTCDAWLAKHQSSVLVLTPTGKATDRLRKELTTGARLQIMTVHRALAIQAARNSPRDDDVLADAGPFDGAGLVVVDEMSMVDSVLFCSLLRDVQRDARLLLSGDPDQLPSVERGDVFAQLLRPEVGLKTVRLTRRFRSTGSILTLADSIRESRELPHEARDGLVEFVECSSPEAILGHVASLYRRHRDDGLQILVPCVRGAVGTNRINVMVHGIEFGTPLPATTTDFQVKALLETGDRIVVTKNDPQCRYFNGQMGIVCTVGDDVVIVKLDGAHGSVRVPKADVAMGYALTVHKSQGSEYGVVVLVLHPSHGRNLTREVVYTAVTRAKTKLYVVSSRATLEDAVRRKRPTRNSKLACMIRHEKGVGGEGRW